MRGMMKGEGMINKAAGEQPKSGHRAPASSGGAATKSDVGNETKANVRGAQMGQPTDGNPLRQAGNELRKQHPIRHDDMGPHHGPKHNHRVV